MIDAIHLAFIEHGLNRVVERSCGFKITPEGLFDDSAAIASGLGHHAGGTEVRDHRFIEPRGDGEVVEAVCGSFLELGKTGVQSRVVFGVSQIAANVEETAGELVVDAVCEERPESVVGVGAAREPDNTNVSIEASFLM